MTNFHPLFCSGVHHGASLHSPILMKTALIHQQSCRKHSNDTPKFGSVVYIYQKPRLQTQDLHPSQANTISRFQVIDPQNVIRARNHGLAPQIWICDMNLPKFQIPTDPDSIRLMLGPDHIRNHSPQNLSAARNHGRGSWRRQWGPRTERRLQAAVVVKWLGIPAPCAPNPRVYQILRYLECNLQGMHHDQGF